MQAVPDPMTRVAVESSEHDEVESAITALRQSIEFQLDVLMDTGADASLDDVARYLGNDPEDEDPLNTASLNMKQLQDLKAFIRDLRGHQAVASSAYELSPTTFPEAAGSAMSTAMRIAQSEPVADIDDELHNFMENRAKPARSPNGTTIRCTRCRFPISSGEFCDERFFACPCGGLVCYDCQEKGRQCRCHGSEARYRTRLCKFYLAGSCPYDRNCQFAHGEAELRIMPQSPSAEVLSTQSAPRSQPRMDHLAFTERAWSDAVSEDELAGVDFGEHDW